MNTPLIHTLTLGLAALTLLQCTPALDPMSPEQTRNHGKVLKRLESIQSHAVAVELYVDPYDVGSETYRKSPRAKRKGELAEQTGSHWRRVELTPEQSATLLTMVKEARLRYSGSPNMVGLPNYAVTLAFRDAQGELLGTINPFDFLAEPSILRSYFRFYQIKEQRAEELHLIIYKAIDETNLLEKKITPSSEPCPDCGRMHPVL